MLLYATGPEQLLKFAGADRLNQGNFYDPEFERLVGRPCAQRSNTIRAWQLPILMLRKMADAFTLTRIPDLIVVDCRSLIPFSISVVLLLPEFSKLCGPAHIWRSRSDSSASSASIIFQRRGRSRALIKNILQCWGHIFELKPHRSRSFHLASRGATASEIFRALD